MPEEEGSTKLVVGGRPLQAASEHEAASMLTVHARMDIMSDVLAPAMMTKDVYKSH